MISEWPITADVRPPVRPVSAAPRHAFACTAADARRLDEATTDLFLNPTRRLSDRVRALAWTMRDDLVLSVERDMRLFLEPRVVGDEALAASLSSASVAIALPLLADGNLLRHQPFAALLLRRAHEAVIGDRLSRRDAGQRDVGQSDAGAVMPLLADTDANVAEAAMALLVAGSRRRDRFGEPVLLFDDLSAELAAWLAWRVAAALRHYLCTIGQLEEADADALLTGAIEVVLGGHDEGRGLNAVAARLAARLHASGRAEGAMLEAFAGAGDMAAFTAVLAAAVHLPDREVWAIVADPDAGRLATLLRAARVERARAAAVLLALDEQGASDALERFDSLDSEAACRTIAPLALDPDYRAAIAAVDAARALAGNGS